MNTDCRLRTAEDLEVRGTCKICIYIHIHICMITKKTSFFKKNLQFVVVKNSVTMKNFLLVSFILTS